MDNNIYAISYQMRKELYRKIFSIFLIGAVFLVLISLFLSFVLYPVVSNSDSMSPDISSGSLEFVCPFLKKPGRGDVILVQNHEVEPVSKLKKSINTVSLFFTARKWQPFEEKPVAGTKPMMRRVVGLPGDTIYIDRYVVFIKPKGENHFLTEFEVTKKKYNVEILVPPAGWDVELGAKSSIEKITLGPDEYFVLGDKRLVSADSRIWGPIGQSKIRGKVLMLYFPFNKFKIF
ncbi:MAG: signal peptidase I [Treponema sp.]|nr:signal peptidase I [Candidatus Treponema equifaecale]